MTHFDIRSVSMFSSKVTENDEKVIYFLVCFLFWGKYGLHAWGNHILQTVQNDCLPFRSGRSNSTISTIYSVLVASTYGKSVFEKNMIFSQNQDAPYVFEQKNRKTFFFKEINTVG